MIEVAPIIALYGGSWIIGAKGARCSLGGSEKILEAYWRLLDFEEFKGQTGGVNNYLTKKMGRFLSLSNDSSNRVVLLVLSSQTHYTP